ncbi:MAG: hypothetical protein K0R03_624 [Moraxellaceae bacterium]|nr:hypothetical protein [Moraxellaceae bacterium]
MMRTACLALMLACVTPPALAAAGRPATPNDFASGAPLQTPGDGPFFRLELPLDVYRQARPDLADVRVFNAEGHAVVYALETSTPPAARPVLREVPAFPLRGDLEGGAGSLDMKIEQGRDGRIIALRSRGDSAAGSRTAAWLLDLSALKRPVRAVQLDWPASTDGYSAEARLEASDDLRSWHTLARAPLLEARFGNHRLEQKRIAFTTGEYRYLRLTADRELPALSVVRAEMLPADSAPPPERWLNVKGEAGTRPGEFLFTPGAYLTATRIEIRLPATNMVAPVELLARSSTREEWRSVARTTAYRLLQGGVEVTSPPVEIAPRPARYWLLRLDPRAGVLGADTPVLRLAWTPQQLVFVAGGKPPFTLAWGRRDATPAQLPLASLMPGYRPGMERTLPEAVPGKVAELGGHDAPQPGQEDQPPADWKRWLLWGVLLGGVVLLACMARGLLKQLPARD